MLSGTVHHFQFKKKNHLERQPFHHRSLLWAQKDDALRAPSFSLSLFFSGIPKSNVFSSVVLTSFKSIGSFPSDSPAHGMNGFYAST
jgi:hypothetical protein